MECIRVRSLALLRSAVARKKWAYSVTKPSLPPQRQGRYLHSNVMKKMYHHCAITGLVSLW